MSSGIAVSGGLVLVGDESGTLYAVQRATGRQAWSFQGENTIVGVPAVADGKVVLVEADGTITCLNLSDGSKVWSFEADIEGIGLTIVDGAAIGDGKVYVAKGDAGLYALSLANGKTVWEYKSDGPELRTAPAFGEGYVMLGEQDGKFSMIDPQTGKRVSGGGTGGPVNTPVIHEGNVYFSSWDGTVQRVQVKGVVPKWKSTVGDPVTTKPVPGDGKLFVGTANGYVAALDAGSGNVLWQYETQGGSVEAAPVFAEGMVEV